VSFAFVSEVVENTVVVVTCRTKDVCYLTFYLYLYLYAYFYIVCMNVNKVVQDGRNEGHSFKFTP
jgi:hypothetical protein